MPATETARAPRPFAQWLLAYRLRRIREERGLTPEEAGRLIDKDRTTIGRMESGDQEIKVERVLALCNVYGVTGSEAIKSLVQLAEATAKRNGFTDNYGGEEWFGLYRGAEQIASTLSIYQPNLVPGPLQTPAYTRAVCEAFYPPLSEEMIGKQIELRLERQQHLLRPETPPHVRAVMGAAVFTRPVGGAETMAAQITQLLEIAEREQVDLRVLPWSVGAHAALASGPFTIVELPEKTDPRFVYLESHTGAQYLERPAELAAYRGLFAAVWDLSVPIQEYMNDRERVDEVHTVRRAG